MSVQDFKRSFVNPLIRELDRETRLRVESQRGQLLLLDDVRAFEIVIKQSTGVDVPTRVAEKALAAGRKKAKVLAQNYKKRAPRRYNLIMKRARENVLKQRNIKENYNTFIVTNFDNSIRAIKQEIIDVLVKELDLEEFRGEITKNVERGHGVEGMAVSQVQIASAFNKASQLEKKFPGFDMELMINNLSTVIGGADADPDDPYVHQIESLAANYQHMITKTGNLKAQYFSIITFQDAASNRSDGVVEKLLVTAFRKFVKTQLVDQIADMKGSPSIRDKFASHMMHEITDGLEGKKNVKVRWADDRLPPGMVSSGKAEEKIDQTDVKFRRHRQPNMRQAQQQPSLASQPLLLLTELNRQLPQQVADNMGSPALNYRTGRFAASVRATEIASTAQGFPSIGFTYQKNPYQVFEMGAGASPWATPDRDPRKIIDRSIREIAAQFAIGRFYTRRV